MLYEGWKFVFYFAAYSRMGWKWIPRFSWNWGESTHWYHPMDEEEGKPINKEWSICCHWLNLMITIDLEKGLDENLPDK